MTNVNINEDKLLPQAGSDSEGRTFSFVTSAAKAAQNDTITLTSAKVIDWAILTIDATGASEDYTISGNVITLTSATTGAVSGIIISR